MPDSLSAKVSSCRAACASLLVRLLLCDMPVVRGEDPPGLSRAERAVAVAVLEGLSNKEIARRRRTSRTTIANQIASIYRKLAIRSRSELAAWGATAAGAALGAPSRAVPRKRFGRLTAGELAVAKLAALGRPNKMIAAELGLGPSTVAHALSRARRKLGLGSRVALVRALATLLKPRRPRSERPEPP